MRAVGRCAALLLVAGLTAAAPRAGVQQDALADILAAGGRYVAAYKQEFFGVVATERYVQSVNAGVQVVGAVGSSGGRRRVFEAEVAILALDGVGWVGFRDIVRVDGREVGDRSDRLMKLLGQAGPDLMKQGRVLANEGSRFNLGSVVRTINHPALAFIFLAHDRQDRSTFALDGAARVDGIATTIVRFSEQARPGTVQGGPGLHVQADGRYWIEPATGRILRAELRLASGPTKATLTSRYGAAPGFTVFVPLSLDERFETARAEVTEGQARYTGFRRFSVDTQEKRGGGGPALH